MLCVGVSFLPSLVFIDQLRFLDDLPDAAEAASLLLNLRCCPVFRLAVHVVRAEAATALTPNATNVDAIQKIAAALGVTTDYFMDDATFQKELSDDQFYADVRKKYGSRGVAQAKKIKEQTSVLFAVGELSEEDQANFIKEMEALFLDAKEEAKKFTPKKYL